MSKEDQTDEQFIKDLIRDFGYDAVLSTYNADLSSAIRHNRAKDMHYSQNFVDIIEKMN